MRVQLTDIHKRFGAVHANAGISLDVPGGTIQGILGENGAGKSTLMKILSGFIHPDGGEILLDDTRVVIRSPADAINHGIGMLHQDPLDFPPMKALDNFMLGSGGGLFPDQRGAARDFNRPAKEFGFLLDPETYVDTLTVGERQQMEILRLLWLGARVLILDEPTTGISLPQKEKLFATLRTLAASGKTVLFVSHKLEDVESLCGRISVLRRGELVGTEQPPYATNRLVELMFCKEVAYLERSNSNPGSVALSLSGVSLKDVRVDLRNVCFEIREGEVVGLAGMEGSGQAAFLAACAGLAKPAGGAVTVGEKNLADQSHHAFRKQGVAFLPAARLERGLVPGLTIAEHFILSEGMRGFLIDWKKAIEITSRESPPTISRARQTQR